MSRPDVIAEGGEAPAKFGVALYVKDDTALSAHVHAGEGRVVVSVGRWPSTQSVDLFADRAALLRLRDFLDDTLAALDGVTDAETTSTDSTSTTSTGTGHDTAA